jgi:pimeloyl-ACP methyl ester carboxylesterase
MYATVDLPALGTDFQVPIFLLQGEEDLLTSPAISKPYFDSLSAPEKKFVLLPRTGHDPNQIMVDAQYRLLTEQILPLTQ